MHTSEHVLVAGAGIGGLTAALTLHERGFTSTVIDRADTLQPLGLGINLLPHAVRELHELGLGKALARIAVAPTSICYFEPDGTLLFREPRGLQGGYGWPQYSVHRGELPNAAARCGAKPTGRCICSHRCESNRFHPSRTRSGHPDDRRRRDKRLPGGGRRHPLDPAGTAASRRRPLMWSGVTLVRGAA